MQRNGLENPFYLPGNCYNTYSKRIWVGTVQHLLRNLALESLHTDLDALAPTPTLPTRMRPTDPSSVLQALAGKVQFMMAYRTLLRWSVVGLMVAGVVVLAIRFKGYDPKDLWEWFAGAWGILAVSAFVHSYRHKPNTGRLLAALDQQNNAGGILMASGEADARSWENKMDPLELPKIRWESGRSWLGMGIASIFVAAAFFIPMKYARLLAEPPLEISQQVERLREQIDVLEKERVLPRDDADGKRKELEQIEKQASGFNPSKTWEALDALQRNNQQLAQQAAAEAQSQIDAINEASLLGQALDMLPKNLQNQQALEQGLQMMGGLLDQLAKQGTLDPSKLPPGLQKAAEEAMKQIAKGGMPDAGQVAQMMKALEGNKGELLQMAQALAQKGLLPNPGDFMNGLQPGKGEGMRGLDPDALGNFLGQNQAGDFGQMARELLQGIPGRGGITRGPGHAELEFSNDSDAAGSEFKEQYLGLSAPITDAEILGVTVTAPEVTGGEAILGKGALDSANAGRGNAITAPILPRHRSAVKSFFDRKGPGE